MSQTPLATVKQRFDSKEKLVAAVEKLATEDLWVGRVNAVKGLARVSNAKLVRLHEILTDAKQRFGSREKLISAIAELAKRPKDEDWAGHLKSYPLPRLLDLHRSLERALRRAGKKARAAGEAKPAKKAAAKAPAKKAAVKTAAKPTKAGAKKAPAKKTKKS